MTDKTLIVFSRAGMGDAPAPLQQKLATTFLTLLAEGALPGALAFYGDGVMLTCEGSPVLDQLKRLSDQGVPLIICQTCLDFFNLRSSVRVGVIGGMGDIMAAMAKADKVMSV
jgi:sulfur relay (sulfurtransferase) complex TusBCD TusD component (DsrE family)